jgi:hypothetical protein
MAYKKFKKLLRGTLVELKDDELDDLADELKVQHIIHRTLHRTMS